MANQLYLIIGIIISNTSWAFVCNGWYKQKMLAGIENGIPFVWDTSLVYYVAIIPAIIGIVFIIQAYKNVVEEHKPKNKKKFTKKTTKSLTTTPKVWYFYATERERRSKKWNSQTTKLKL